MIEKDIIEKAVEYIRSKTDFQPEIGIVLGTGLGAMVSHIEIACKLEYSHIPGFPEATVEFHHGRLLFGHLAGRRVVCMQGRFHYYEGYSAQEVVRPIRVMKLLGVHTLLLSNAAGAINPAFKKGDMMLISDHINLQPDNPLRGANLDFLGPRFPDMSDTYDKQLRNLMLDEARAEGLHVHEGIYASVPGPNLETAAEYRFLGRMGADAVGMSTVPEVIAARQMGMRVAAVSILTDECDPDNLQAVNIEEIIAVAMASEKKLIQWTLSCLPKM
jgi:purine-nucleoside phosphorylase